MLCWHGARETHNQSLGGKQIIFIMNTLTVLLVLALQIKDVSDETMVSRSKLCFFLWCRQRVLNDTDLIRQSRKLRCSSKCLFVFYELHWLTVPISKGVWPAFLLLFFPLFSPLLKLFLDRYSLPRSRTHTERMFGVSLAWCAGRRASLGSPLPYLHVNHSVCVNISCNDLHPACRCVLAPGFPRPRSKPFPS